MSSTERPDGTKLHWEVTGDGPLAVVANQVFADPEVISGLVEELARDHRVLTFDARGTGESSAQGPYEKRTDATDLIALIEEAGGPAAIVGLGDAGDVAVLAAAQRPELVSGVVVPFGNPVAIRAAATSGSEALVGSRSVLEALGEMLSNDYRAGLRTIISGGNPQMAEEEIRERVMRQEAYCPAEVALARLESWQGDLVYDEAQAIGDRLWLLQQPENPWFPADMVERTAELLPKARIVRVEDGHISRPDITAGFVSRITADN
jgi:pimeloyl-ACP methyl ester carboxylesterase